MEENLSGVDPEESKRSNVKEIRGKNRWSKNSVPKTSKSIGLIQLMLLVSFLGFILFVSAAQAVYLLVYQTKTNNSLLALIALCLAAAFLFLLDAFIMIWYWRYTHAKKGKCLPCNPDKSLTILYQKPSREALEDRRSKSKLTTRDIGTSFSRERWESSYPEFLDPRRQYVDRATNPDLNTSAKIVETQTHKIEPAKQIDHETSAIAVVEEKDAQTLSECPMCAAALDYSPEEICPTFLNLVQSFGMFSCAGGLQALSEAPVLVDRGTLPGSNPGCKVTESMIMVTKKPPRIYETRPCPTHGAGLIAQKAGLPNPVKRITLTHSIKKNKRTQTPGIRPIVITEKCQNTEIDTAEETTNTESSQQHRGNLSEHQISEKVDIRTEKSSDLAVVESNKIGIKAENSPEFDGNFGGQESFEAGKVQIREGSVMESIGVSKTGNEEESVSKKESLAPNVLSSFERRDFHPDSEKKTSKKDIVKEEKGEIGSTLSGTKMFLSEKGSSGKFQAPIRESSLLVEIKESCSKFGDNFVPQRSSDKMCISTQGITSGFEKNEETSTESKKGSPTNQKYLPPEVLSSLAKRTLTHERITSQRNIFKKNNKVESSTSTRSSLLRQVSSYFAEASSYHESPIYPVEISRYSDRSRESASPGPPCKCAQYYYKDVFGRDICSLCAHKYLIKIPQRCTVNTVGDKRCCSCYQAIFYQTPTNAGHTKCQRCCKCRYQMYAGSKK